MKKRDHKKIEDKFKDLPDKFFTHEATQENDLFHEKAFIGTELGGEGRRLRYFVVISTENSSSFSQEQKAIVTNKFSNICQKFGAKMEEIIFNKNYVVIKILVSMDVAVGDVIEKAINLCTEQQKFLRFHYFVTNVKKPSRLEIKRYLEEISD